MHMRVTGWVGAVGLTFAALVAPNTSRAHTDVIVGIAPPAARVEVAPHARAGYIWAPGYWRWNGHHHAWVGGYWIPARPGWRWEQARWAPYGHRWRYHPGYWAH
jgi:hypothetical protein